MQLLVPCMKCLHEFGIPNLKFMNAEICDDGIYKLTCDRGHETITMLQNEKFEILFDMGAFALLDGYSREAVSSFAASLERFYEFCIKIFILCEKIDKEEFYKTWKLVSNQSERQLGAFYFLYLNFFRRAPTQISAKQVEFRNKVIHKGYIPQYTEVKNYAECILGYIYSVLKEIQLTCKEEIIQLTKEQLHIMLQTV